MCRPLHYVRGLMKRCVVPVCRRFLNLVLRKGDEETMEETRKPTLYDLKVAHHFDLLELAVKAGVHDLVVYSMLTGKPVRRWQARLILTALCEITGLSYTLDMVRVVFIEENEGDLTLL